MKNLFFKKTFLLFVLASVIGLASCGSDSAQTTTKKAAPSDVTTETKAAPIVKAAEPAQAARWKPEPTPEPVELGEETPYTTKRTEFVKKYGLPLSYQNLKNPLAPTTENLTAGGVLFRTRCALCHGNKGKGDGVAGAALRPPASDLSKITIMDMATEGYFFWAVSEGGGRLKTAMPTFNIMPEEERWQIILFIKSELGNK